MAAKKSFKQDVAENFITTAPEPEKKAAPAKKKAGVAAAVPEGYKLVPENKSERMQLLVRPTIKDGIRKEAEAQGISMNDLVNNIFKEYLERKGKK